MTAGAGGGYRYPVSPLHADFRVRVPSPEPLFYPHVSGLDSGRIWGKAIFLQKLLSKRNDF